MTDLGARLPILADGLVWAVATDPDGDYVVQLVSTSGVEASITVEVDRGFLGLATPLDAGPLILQAAEVIYARLTSPYVGVWRSKDGRMVKD